MMWGIASHRRALAALWPPSGRPLAVALALGMGIGGMSDCPASFPLADFSRSPLAVARDCNSHQYGWHLEIIS